MMDTSQDRDDVSAVFSAGNDIVDLLTPHYTFAGILKPESVIAAAAALTGEWGLHSLGKTLPESGFIVSNEINQVLTEGDGAVWLFVEKAVVEAGMPHSQLPDVAAAVTRNAAAIGSAPYPPISVPEKHLPDEWSPHACPRYRNNIAAIAKRHNLDDMETVFACAIATATLIVETSATIDPAVTTQLALEMMIGVSRMAPLTITGKKAIIEPGRGDNDNVPGNNQTPDICQITDKKTDKDTCHGVVVKMARSKPKFW